MSTLVERIAVAPRREKVVEDCVHLIDAQVKHKSGLSGMAIKGAYATIKTIKTAKMCLSKRRGMSTSKRTDKRAPGSQPAPARFATILDRTRGKGPAATALVPESCHINVRTWAW